MSEPKVIFKASFTLHIAEVEDVTTGENDRRIVVTAIDRKLNEQGSISSAVYKAGTDVEPFLREALRDMTKMVAVRALGLYREGLTA